jgi:ParB-like chromosome segregation protein Spo0J
MRSIARNGLQVPIIVLREVGSYQLVCGHRRVVALAALRSEGCKSLPDGVARISRGKLMVMAVVLGAVSRRRAAFVGFIENRERVDLSPYEQACCYKTFVEELGYTRKELSERVPLDRTTLDYLIGALDGTALTPKMVQAWKERRLQQGHIRVLFRLRAERKKQLELFKRILAERLSKKDAELYCNELQNPEDKRLDRRELDRIRKGVLADTALSELIEDKELAWGPSSIGDQLDLKFTDTKDLERKLKALLACVRGLGG